MIAMVEGAQRRKTPNEIALTILLIALTMVFLLATATIWPFSAWGGNAVSVTVLVALLVCLIPTIGGLLSAIGVAGMSRMLGANVIATSGRAVEAAGDVDVCCWIKPGPLPSATARLPISARPGVEEKTLADAAQLSSLADETPEGRSIVVWRSSALTCANASAVAARHLCAVYRPKSDERHQHRQPMIRKGG
jgi:K+-transporting ATPase ATPase B chain